MHRVLRVYMFILKNKSLNFSLLLFLICLSNFNFDLCFCNNGPSLPLKVDKLNRTKGSIQSLGIKEVENKVRLFEFTEKCLFTAIKQIRKRRNHGKIDFMKIKKISQTGMKLKSQDHFEKIADKKVQGSDGFFRDIQDMDTTFYNIISKPKDTESLEGCHNSKNSLDSLFTSSNSVWKPRNSYNFKTADSTEKSQNSTLTPINSISETSNSDNLKTGHYKERPQDNVFSSQNTMFKPGNYNNLETGHYVEKTQDVVLNSQNDVSNHEISDNLEICNCAERTQDVVLNSQNNVSNHEISDNLKICNCAERTQDVVLVSQNNVFNHEISDNLETGHYAEMSPDSLSTSKNTVSEPDNFGVVVERTFETTPCRNNLLKRRDFSQNDVQKIFTGVMGWKNRDNQTDNIKYFQKELNEEKSQIFEFGDQENPTEIDDKSSNILLKGNQVGLDHNSTNSLFNGISGDIQRESMSKDSDVKHQVLNSNPKKEIISNLDTTMSNEKMCDDEGQVLSSDIKTEILSNLEMPLNSRSINRDEFHVLNSDLKTDIVSNLCAPSQNETVQDEPYHIKSSDCIQSNNIGCGVVYSSLILSGDSQKGQQPSSSAFDIFPNNKNYEGLKSYSKENKSEIARDRNLKDSTEILSLDLLISKDSLKKNDIDIRILHDDMNLEPTKQKSDHQSILKNDQHTIVFDLKTDDIVNTDFRAEDIMNRHVEGGNVVKTNLDAGDIVIRDPVTGYNPKNNLDIGHIEDTETEYTPKVELGSENTLEGDLGTSPIVDNDLETEHTPKADLQTNLALKGNSESEYVLREDLSDSLLRPSTELNLQNGLDYPIVLQNTLINNPNKDELQIKKHILDPFCFNKQTQSKSKSSFKDIEKPKKISVEKNTGTQETQNLDKYREIYSHNRDSASKSNSLKIDTFVLENLEEVDRNTCRSSYETDYDKNVNNSKNARSFNSHEVLSQFKSPKSDVSIYSDPVNDLSSDIKSLESNSNSYKQHKLENKVLDDETIDLLEKSLEPEKANDDTGLKFQKYGNEDQYANFGECLKKRDFIQKNTYHKSSPLHITDNIDKFSDIKTKQKRIYIQRFLQDRCKNILKGRCASQVVKYFNLIDLLKIEYLKNILKGRYASPVIQFFRNLDLLGKVYLNKILYGRYTTRAIQYFNSIDLLKSEYLKNIIAGKYASQAVQFFHSISNNHKNQNRLIPIPKTASNELVPYKNCLEKKKIKSKKFYKKHLKQGFLKKKEDLDKQKVSIKLLNTKEDHINIKDMNKYSKIKVEIKSEKDTYTMTLVDNEYGLYSIPLKRNKSKFVILPNEDIKRGLFLINDGELKGYFLKEGQYFKVFSSDGHYYVQNTTYQTPKSSKKENDRNSKVVKLFIINDYDRLEYYKDKTNTTTYEIFTQMRKFLEPVDWNGYRLRFVLSGVLNVFENNFSLTDDPDDVLDDVKIHPSKNSGEPSKNIDTLTESQPIESSSNYNLDEITSKNVDDNLSDEESKSYTAQKNLKKIHKRHHRLNHKKRRFFNNKESANNLIQNKLGDKNPPYGDSGDGENLLVVNNRNDETFLSKNISKIKALEIEDIKDEVKSKSLAVEDSRDGVSEISLSKEVPKDGNLVFKDKRDIKNPAVLGDSEVVLESRENQHRDRASHKKNNDILKDHISSSSVIQESHQSQRELSTSTNSGPDNRASIDKLNNPNGNENDELPDYLNTEEADHPEDTSNKKKSISHLLNSQQNTIEDNDDIVSEKRTPTGNLKYFSNLAECVDAKIPKEASKHQKTDKIKAKKRGFNNKDAYISDKNNNSKDRFLHKKFKNSSSSNDSWNVHDFRKYLEDNKHKSKLLPQTNTYNPWTSEDTIQGKLIDQKVPQNSSSKSGLLPLTNTYNPWIAENTLNESTKDQKSPEHNKLKSGPLPNSNNPIIINPSLKNAVIHSEISNSVTNNRNLESFIQKNGGQKSASTKTPIISLPTFSENDQSNSSKIDDQESTKLNNKLKPIDSNSYSISGNDSKSPKLSPFDDHSRQKKRPSNFLQKNANEQIEGKSLIQSSENSKKKYKLSEDTLAEQNNIPKHEDINISKNRYIPEKNSSASGIPKNGILESKDLAVEETKNGNENPNEDISDGISNESLLSDSNSSQDVISKTFQLANGNSGSNKDFPQKIPEDKRQESDSLDVEIEPYNSHDSQNESSKAVEPTEIDSSYIYTEDPSDFPQDDSSKASEPSNINFALKNNNFDTMDRENLSISSFSDDNYISESYNEVNGSSNDSHGEFIEESDGEPIDDSGENSSDQSRLHEQEKFVKEVNDNRIYSSYNGMTGSNKISNRVKLQSKSKTSSVTDKGLVKKASRSPDLNKNPDSLFKNSIKANNNTNIIPLPTNFYQKRRAAKNSEQKNLKRVISQHFNTDKQSKKQAKKLNMNDRADPENSDCFLGPTNESNKKAQNINFDNGESLKQEMISPYKNCLEKKNNQINNSKKSENLQSFMNLTNQYRKNGVQHGSSDKECKRSRKKLQGLANQNISKGALKSMHKRRSADKFQKHVHSKKINTVFNEKFVDNQKDSDMLQLDLNNSNEDYDMFQPNTNTTYENLHKLKSDSNSKDLNEVSNRYDKIDQADMDRMSLNEHESNNALNSNNTLYRPDKKLVPSKEQHQKIRRRNDSAKKLIKNRLETNSKHMPHSKAVKRVNNERINITNSFQINNNNHEIDDFKKRYYDSERTQLLNTHDSNRINGEFEDVEEYLGDSEFSTQSKGFEESEDIINLESREKMLANFLSEYILQSIKRLNKNSAKTENKDLEPDSDKLKSNDYNLNPSNNDNEIRSNEDNDTNSFRRSDAKGVEHTTTDSRPQFDRTKRAETANGNVGDFEPPEYSNDIFLKEIRDRDGDSLPHTPHNTFPSRNNTTKSPIYSNDATSRDLNAISGQNRCTQITAKNSPFCQNMNPGDPQKVEPIYSDPSHIVDSYTTKPELEKIETKNILTKIDKEAPGDNITKKTENVVDTQKKNTKGDLPDAAKNQESMTSKSGVETTLQSPKTENNITPAVIYQQKSFKNTPEPQKPNKQPSPVKTSQTSEHIDSDVQNSLAIENKPETITVSEESLDPYKQSSLATDSKPTQNSNSDIQKLEKLVVPSISPQTREFRKNSSTSDSNADNHVNEKLPDLFTNITPVENTDKSLLLSNLSSSTVNALMKLDEIIRLLRVPTPTKKPQKETTDIDKITAQSREKTIFTQNNLINQNMTLKNSNENNSLAFVENRNQTLNRSHNNAGYSDNINLNKNLLKIPNDPNILNQKYRNSEDAELLKHSIYTAPPQTFNELQEANQQNFYNTNSNLFNNDSKESLVTQKEVAIHEEEDQEEEPFSISQTDNPPLKASDQFMGNRIPAKIQTDKGHLFIHSPIQRQNLNEFLRSSNSGDRLGYSQRTEEFSGSTNNKNKINYQDTDTKPQYNDQRDFGKIDKRLSLAQSLRNNEYISNKPGEWYGMQRPNENPELIFSNRNPENKQSDLPRSHAFFDDPQSNTNGSSENLRPDLPNNRLFLHSPQKNSLTNSPNNQISFDDLQTNTNGSSNSNLNSDERYDGLETADTLRSELIDKIQELGHALVHYYKKKSVTHHTIGHIAPTNMDSSCKIHNFNASNKSKDIKRNYSANKPQNEKKMNSQKTKKHRNFNPTHAITGDLNFLTNKETSQKVYDNLMIGDVKMHKTELEKSNQTLTHRSGLIASDQNLNYEKLKRYLLNKHGNPTQGSIGNKKRHKGDYFYHDKTAFLETTQSLSEKEEDRSKQLNAFAEIFTNLKEELSNVHIDTANLIIHLKAHENIDEKNSTSDGIEGLTYIGGACSFLDTYSVINLRETDSTFYHAKVLAHEILHSLGAKHDTQSGYLMESESCIVCRESNVQVSDKSRKSVGSLISQSTSSCFEVPENLYACENGLLVDISYIDGDFDFYCENLYEILTSKSDLIFKELFKDNSTESDDILGQKNSLISLDSQNNWINESESDHNLDSIADDIAIKNFNSLSKRDLKTTNSESFNNKKINTLISTKKNDDSGVNNMVNIDNRSTSFSNDNLDKNTTSTKSTKPPHSNIFSRVLKFFSSMLPFKQKTQSHLIHKVKNSEYKLGSSTNLKIIHEKRLTPSINIISKKCNSNSDDTSIYCPDGFILNGICQTRDLYCQRANLAFSTLCPDSFSCQLVCSRKNDCILVGSLLSTNNTIIDTNHSQDYYQDSLNKNISGNTSRPVYSGPLVNTGLSVDPQSAPIILPDGMPCKNGSVLGSCFNGICITKTNTQSEKSYLICE